MTIVCPESRRKVLWPGRLHRRSANSPHGGSAMELERKLAAANSTAKLLAVRRRWWFVAQWADAEPPDDEGEVLNAMAIGGVTRKEGPLDELEVAGAGPEAWRDMTLGTWKLVKFKGHKVRRCAELLYFPCYLKYCGIQGRGQLHLDLDSACRSRCNIN